MTLLAIEISDTGIIAAAGQPPRLLPVDGENMESPGFALADRKKMLAGVAARQQAHLLPRLIFDAFWDQLNTEALSRPLPRIGTHAEIAYFHLQRIWKRVPLGISEVVMAVPAHFDQHQLGIILSIAKELSMPLKGFVALAIAAARQIPETGPLLHLDVHLHRLEITRMTVNERISLEDSRWLEEKGLIYLYRQWAETVAAEFVQTTRFDPLHRAATEQTLYDRLPDLLGDIEGNGSAALEMRSGQAIHRVTVTRDLLANSVEPVLMETRRLIEQLGEGRRNGTPLTIQYTHRMETLAGFKTMIAGMENVRLVKLPPGAAALGVIDLWNFFKNPQADTQALYFTSRLREGIQIAEENAPTPNPSVVSTLPVTHVLYENTAYPLSAAPLVIGSQPPSHAAGLALKRADDVLPQHCALRVEDGEAMLEIYGNGQTWVDGRPILKNCRLSLGQTLRIGTPGTNLRLITCLKHHET